MQKHWIIADYHYGHYNIIKHCNRPFWHEVWNEDIQGYIPEPNVHEMNKVMTENTNSVVGVNDVLHIVGDIAYRGQNADFYRKQIKCRNVNLILGNHDDHNISKYKTFTSVQHYSELKYNGRLIVLSHYPMRSWRNSFHGSLHCYGHVHHNIEPIGRSIDVGIDGKDYNFTPLSLDWIIEKLEKIPIK